MNGISSSGMLQIARRAAARVPRERWLARVVAEAVACEHRVERLRLALETGVRLADDLARRNGRWAPYQERIELGEARCLQSAAVHEPTELGSGEQKWPL